MVTIDISLLRLNYDQLEVLLIQRKNDPFQNKWALPGGFVDIDEPLEVAAKRELLEETGLDNIPLCKIDIFGDPGRDPRGRTITILYLGVLPPGSSKPEKAGDDAADAKWFALDKLPELAFDHRRIVEVCYEKFRSNMLLKFWFLLFVENEFNINQIIYLLDSISELKLSVAKLRHILFNLPFARPANGKETFFKDISNTEILNLDDSELTRIWQNMLTN
jgi:8-oxo-dGTP diphosphatase